VLFPERHVWRWCAFWRNRAGGTNGGGGVGGIRTHTMPRGPERCLRESDGPFDVMYVVQRRNGTKGKNPSSQFTSEHTHASKHAHARAHKSKQIPSYYPDHLTLIRDLHAPETVVTIFFPRFGVS